MAGFSIPIFQFLLLNGTPNASGKIYVYQTGTTTTVNIYADNGLTTPLTNPLTLDANGEAKFYVGTSTLLRIDSYDVNNGFVQSIDPVFPVSSSSSATITSINGGQIAGFRNRVVNGGMQVQTRWNKTLTSSYLIGVVDHIMAAAAGGSSVSGTITSASNQATSTGLALALTNISYTNGAFSVQTAMEAADVADLNGKTVTAQIKMYHDFGTSRTVFCTLYKANTLNNFTSSGITQIGSTITAGIVPTATFTTLTATFTLGSTDATNGLLLRFSDGVATTVANKNLYFGDMGLEPGAVATPYESRGYAIEQTRCRRYFRMSYNPTVAPGTASMATGERAYIAGAPRTQLDFDTPMIGTPGIITFYSPSTGASGFGHNNTTSADVAFTATEQNMYGMRVANTGTNVAGQDIFYHYVADSELISG